MVGLQSLSIFKVDFYNKLIENASLGKQISHDLNNFATPLLGIFSIIDKCSQNKKYAKRVLDFLKKNIPGYCLVLEDVLSEQFEGENQIKRKLDFVQIEKTVSGFRQTSAVKGNVGKRLAEFEAVEVLKLDEEVVSYPAFVTNALLNIIRNACNPNIEKEGVDLKAKIRMFRDGEEVVLQVVDNGKGIEQNNLLSVVKNELGEDEKNEKFIFNKGVSIDNQSTGLGLAGLDKRALDKQIKFSVMSFVEDKLNTFSNYDRHEYLSGEDRKKIGEEIDLLPTTIFEMRLPISKKTS